MQISTVPQASANTWFREPAAEFRGLPLWSWNAALEPEEMLRQIGLLKEMGFGGFFMHPRVGLETAYLSDEWFDLTRLCVDEAKRLGMTAWIYDEDRWPSGGAGGLVTRDPALRLRRLVAETHASVREADAAEADGHETVARFAVVLEGEAARSSRRLGPGDALRAGEACVRFRVHVMETSDWYNGAAYLDNLNPAAVARFLEVTHEAYARRHGDDFGRTIPGIFTDEPNIGHLQPGISWTAGLPAAYRERFGEDLLDSLPALFFDGPRDATAETRFRYHHLRTEMFADAFTRQIGAWCEEHGVMLTGHVLLEDTLSRQAEHVGSVMRQLEPMQAPGMDLLTERWRVYETAKQVSSVARQVGRRWRLTETYGCTGWDFSFAGHKALGDWQAALGINLRCHHLSLYTLLGECKRDYPASVFDQSPWWASYGEVETYFARIHAALDRPGSREVRDVLVLHPVESVWLHTRPGGMETPAVEALDASVIRVRDALLGAGIDFDYGDEEMLGRLGSVEEGPTLRVGEAVYRVVVVPPMETIRSATLALLRGFLDAGGRVVFAGEPAGLVDARPAPAAAALAGRAEGGDRWLDAVGERGRRLRFREPDGSAAASLLHLLREDEEAWTLFVCNTGHRDDQRPAHMNDPLRCVERTRAYPRLSISGFAGAAGRPVELDPATGRVLRPAAERSGDGWTIDTSLPALGSRLFRVPKAGGEDEDLPPSDDRFEEVRAVAASDGPYAIERSEPNVIVLDRARFGFDGEPLRSEADVLAIDRLFRDRVGMPHRGGQMKQPWARDPVTDPRGADVEMRFSFIVEAPPTGDLWLGIERPATFRLDLDGEAVAVADDGFWCDRAIRRVPLPADRLRKGVHTLTVRGRVDELHPGLEAVYLLGGFGARVDGLDMVMTAEPTAVALGDWNGQGLPMYGGNLTHALTVEVPEHRPGDRLVLSLPGFDAVAARVRVGGVDALVAWPPFEADLTEALSGRSGDVGLEVELLGHRRNCLGPLHHRDLWPEWTGPECYDPGGPLDVERYQFVPVGLRARPVLSVRRLRDA
ncbi:hypothetical protein PSMK_17850 [Phycisphaera mikurensis NBRC 102666]|uniref:Glycoside hydrolase n=1 Tax=Phycisphaera mikurensis (strain NBRC 102666 / KCTC 22515 / FYK2301M01) TaxID=1142394 RepID=I0IFA6_PHYMF|nr:hypothetical protein PSMK_17850 [Phycisphaera mikurensis NBRC 102666]